MTNEEENKINKQHLGIMRVSMELLKHVFLLPDDYEVLSIHVDSLTNELRLLVSNPTLPVAIEYQQLPVVYPTYSVDYKDGVKSAPYITNIRVFEHPVQSREEVLASL